jgi:hypothetical protein
MSGGVERKRAGFNWVLPLMLVLSIEVWVAVMTFVAGHW